MSLSSRVNVYWVLGLHSGRASNSELKGFGFDPHRRHRVVSVNKPLKLPKLMIDIKEEVAPF